MNDHERTSGGFFTTLLVGAVCLLLSLGGGVGFFMFRQQQAELADMRRELALQQEMLAASREQSAKADLSELLEIVPKDPLQPAPTTDPPQVVEVVIGEEGRLAVNGEKMTADELRTLLVVDRLEHAVAVKIRVHEKTPLRKYLAVMNACADAGVRDTSTVTEPDAP